MNYAQKKASESEGPWLRNALRNAYIKFCTTEDRTQGCQELLAHSPVSSLSNGIFCIPWNSLVLLDARQVEYTFANEDDLSDARPIWNFAAAR